MATTSSSSSIPIAVVTCGDLKGAYTNVQAPICSGQYNTCTFSNSLQGCCDSQKSCRFYTTCNGLYAPQTCAGSSCLSCPSAAPYCVKYNFWDSSSQLGYDGYSCGAFNAQQTVFGVATSIGASAQSTSTSASSSLLSSLRTMTSSTASATSTSQPEASSSHSSNTGKIVGGAVGGVFGLALIIGGLWWYLKHWHDRSDSDSEEIFEVQQRREYGHNSTINPLLHTEQNT